MMGNAVMMGNAAGMAPKGGDGGGNGNNGGGGGGDAVGSWYRGR